MAIQKRWTIVRPRFEYVDTDNGSYTIETGARGPGAEITYKRIYGRRGDERVDITIESSFTRDGIPFRRISGTNITALDILLDR